MFNILKIKKNELQKEGQENANYKASTPFYNLDGIKADQTKN